MRACSLHNVEMVARARVLRARGGWEVWTYFACPRAGCSHKRTQKRGGDHVFQKRGYAEFVAAQINRREPTRTTMTVEGLVKLLDKLPQGARILVSQDVNDFKADEIVGVDRILLNPDCKGSGGKTIAALIRFHCDHA